MKILRSIAAAFSMFSAIPIPYGRGLREGDEKGNEDMRYFLCAFPLVGVVIGLLSVLAAYLCARLGLPGILRGMLMTLIPVTVTGGIHLDGYADTIDALSCLGDIEKKHEILRDPHIGSFAVIRLCLYFIITFAVWSSLPEIPYINIILMYTLSRILSGLSVVSFPVYNDTGLAHMFSDAADKKRVRMILIISDVAILAAFATQGYEGIVMAAAAHVVFLIYRRISRVQFDGLSGDLCGWFLCKCEIWMLLAMAVCQFLTSFTESLKA